MLCVEWDPIERKLASGGHDGHVRLWDPRSGKPIGDAMKVWSTATRRLEYTLGGHTASVNVVKWGGGGKGVLYTASSDRTARVWNAQGVKLFVPHSSGKSIDYLQGKQLVDLKDHAHWVTTLALNTDFVFPTGPFDHTATRPSSDKVPLMMADL